MPLLLLIFLSLCIFKEIQFDSSYTLICVHHPYLLVIFSHVSLFEFETMGDEQYGAPVKGSMDESQRYKIIRVKTSASSYISLYNQIFISGLIMERWKRVL
jgi:hypothetical protein